MYNSNLLNKVVVHEQKTSAITTLLTALFISHSDGIVLIDDWVSVSNSDASSLIEVRVLRWFC
jgi:hypothetical protein